MKKRIFGLIATSALITAGVALTSGEQDKTLEAQAATIYNFTEVALASNNRTDDNIGNEMSGYRINWQQDSMPANLFSNNVTFVRLEVEVETAGDYEYTVYATNHGGIEIVNYVNSVSGKQPTLTIPSNNWASDTETSVSALLPLEAGKNIVVTQWNSWGKLTKFAFPVGVNVISSRPPHVAGVYEQAEMLITKTFFENASTSVFNKEAPPLLDTFNVDGSQSFEGAAALTYTPLGTTKSLDIHINNKSAELGVLQVMFGHGERSVSTTYTVDPGESIVHVPSYTYGQHTTLGAPNYIRFSAKGGNIQMIKMVESTVEDELPFEPQKFFPAEIKEKGRILGRSYPLDDAIALDWSASGLEFEFEGSGDVSANMTILSNTQSTKFAVEVNGEFTGYVPVSETTLLARNLPEGRHHIKFYKTSEAAGNLMQINYLNIDYGSLVPLSSPLPKYKFEFIGASNTTGNQVAQGVQDAYIAFPHLIAEAYDGTYNTVAASGRGLIQGYNSDEGWAPSNDPATQIGGIWEWTSYFRSHEPDTVSGDGQVVLSKDRFDHSTYVPDVVIINVGSNDLGQAIMATFGTEITTFTDAVKAFDTKLRNTYQNENLVVMFFYGNFINRDYMDEFKTAVESIGNPKTVFKEIPQMMHGDSGHLNDLDNDAMAAMISEQLYPLLGLSEDPYVRRYEHTIIEAEDTIISGGNIIDGDPGFYWSGLKYVGGMEPNASSANTTTEIAPNLSNIKHLKFEFTAPKSSTYELRLGYATSVDTNIGIRVDEGEWISVEGLNAGDWAGGHGIYEPVMIDLTKGTHTIYITGALNEDGWINYDYFALVKKGDLDTVDVSFSAGEGFDLVGLSEEAKLGESLTFVVAVDEIYSKSSIIVKNNGEVIEPNADGSYTIANVNASIRITVEGVSKNTWTLYYVDTNLEVLHSETLQVGENIVLSDFEPTKEGYIFEGWDFEEVVMPNNDVYVVAKWTKQVEVEVVKQQSLALPIILSLFGGVAIGVGATLGAGALLKKKRTNEAKDNDGGN